MLLEKSVDALLLLVAGGLGGGFEGRPFRIEGFLGLCLRMALIWRRLCLWLGHLHSGVRVGVGV